MYPIMKTLRLVIATVALFAGLNSFAQNTISQELVDITISSETTREQLMYLRNDLQAVGVTFDYSPTFDGNRHLTGIEFTVKGEGINGEYKLPAFAPNQAVHVNIVRQNGNAPVVQINPIQKKK
jgi:hypothetical protein